MNFPSRQLVGALLYLSVGTRPDISFSTGLLARYQDKPNLSFCKALIHLLKYVNSTKHYKIKFGGSLVTLVGYSDSDWAGDRLSKYEFVFRGRRDFQSLLVRWTTGERKDILVRWYDSPRRCQRSLFLTSRSFDERDSGSYALNDEITCDLLCIEIEEVSRCNVNNDKDVFVLKYD
jgi:hypothetical protein